jgi:hypothetical protein
MGSSAPKTPTNTTQTVNQNNIPEFMQPYFNTLMNSAQQQVYQRDASGKVTGMQPYQPYSTNPNDYVAPLSGLQNQAIQSAGNLKVPGQFQQGSQMVGGAGQQGMGAGAGAMGIGMQAANAGNQYNKMATDPNSMKGFMSPYMQNVVNYETQQANRQYDITGQEQQAAAARSGAFGGSREAIMGAENERNRNQAITGIQSTGAEKAFQNAQQAQQFGANLGMQGYDTGIRGMSAGIQGAQTGIQAGLGLGTLGAGQLGAQRDIMNTQAQFGQMQQDQQQKLINAAIQNYDKSQAYPQEQMTFLSSLLRGFQPNSPSSSTVQNYQASPNWMSQLFGGIGAAGSMYNAYKKEGGLVGYSVGGSIESDLDQMDPEQLQEIIQTTTSDIERQMAKKLLAEKTMAGGGIIAFAQGGSMREQMDRISQEMTAKDYKAHGGTKQDIKDYKSSGKIPIDPKKQLALRTPEELPNYPGGKGDYARQMEDFQRQSRLAPASEVINLPDENVTPRAGRTTNTPPYRPLGIANPDIPGGPVEAELSGRNLPPPTSEGEVMPRQPAPAGLGGPERPAIEGQTGKLIYGEHTQAEYDRLMKERATAPKGPRFASAEQQKWFEETQAQNAPKPGAAAPKAPGSWAEEGQSISGQTIKRGLGKVASTLGKGLGAAGALVGIAEAGSEPSELDKYLAVRAENGDVQAKQVLDSGGSDSIMENLKAPIRDVIGKMDVAGAWEAIKGAFSGGIDSVQAAPTEQPTLNVPQPLQAEPAPAGIPQLQGSMTPTGAGGGEGTWQEAPPLNQGIPQATPQSAGSPFDPLIAEDQANLNNLQDTPYETPEALLKRRAEIMGQRTNTADESKRQFNLRMADFFAHWGSTPGPVIVAGLKALTETMPGFLKDKDDQEKLSRTLSEAQFQIDWADHLEKKGHTEKAAAEREKASETLRSDKRLKAAAEAKFAESEMEQFNQNNRNYADNMTKFTTAQMTNSPNSVKNTNLDNLMGQYNAQIKSADAILQSDDPAVVLAGEDISKLSTEQIDRKMVLKKQNVAEYKSKSEEALNGVMEQMKQGGGNTSGGGGYDFHGTKLSPSEAKAFLKFNQGT